MVSTFTSTKGTEGTDTTCQTVGGGPGSCSHKHVGLCAAFWVVVRWQFASSCKQVTQSLLPPLLGLTSPLSVVTTVCQVTTYFSRLDMVGRDVIEWNGRELFLKDVFNVRSIKGLSSTLDHNAWLS